MGASIRTGLRRLLRTPAFTATAVLTLALGIGANTAIFSVVDAVLIEPLPFRDSGELVGLWHEAPGLGMEALNQSPGSYVTYRTETELLEEVALWDNTSVQVTGLESPEQVPAMTVSDNFLRTLGVSPALGRDFTPEDDQGGAARTALVSHDFWQRTMGGDPSALGRSISLSGYPTTVIGVMPEGFVFLNNQADVYFPPRFDLSEIGMGNFSYQAIGRLLPGVTVDRVKVEFDRLGFRAVERFPGPVTAEMLESVGFASVINPLKDELVGPVRAILWILLGTTGLVLLVACANVANLFLVRAEGRVRQMAVQKALGAKRSRIAGEFLVESMLLSMAAGLAGLTMAWGGLELLTRMAPAELPRLEAIGLDGSVLAFTALLTVFAGMVFGAVPLFKYGNPNLTSALKDGGRAGHGRDRNRTRAVLVTAQVAMAMVLLVGSGLMFRSFQALQEVDPGFTGPDNLMTFRASIPEPVIEDPREVAVAYEQILASVGDIPGVEAVGASTSITMDGFDNNDAVIVEDSPPAEGQVPPVRRVKRVLPGYFAAMGNQIIAGRDVDWTDVHEGRRVVVITEDLAREYWSSPSDALGRRMGRAISDVDADFAEIIGVVGNIRDDGLRQPEVATTFWPLLQPTREVTESGEPAVGTWRTMAFAVRAPEAVLSGLLPQLQEAVWSVSASVPLSDVMTQRERMRESTAQISFTLVLLAIAAIVGLILGAVGIYGVTTYSVTQRTREIGLRMALGAEADRVVSMVLRQGMTLAVIGLAVGFAACLGLTRLMSSLLYGVEPLDLMTFGAVAAVLAGISALASWLPARRAAGVDPAISLQSE